MSKRFLCLGYGYTARAFARSLAAEGWRVAGTARSDAAARIIADDGAEIVPWKDSFDAAALENAGAVLVSVPPNGEGCPALAAARAAIPARG
ncbi:MAG: SDR family NAD(P)-dependent oxidoreductase, partial [Amphiplicatus sp.]